jgi:glycosyltransferase involved in cell wall biosynthesis
MSLSSGKTGGPRVLLFDWQASGHHPLYASRIAGALAGHAQVFVAAPQDLFERATFSACDRIILSDSRPSHDFSRRLSRDVRRAKRLEIRRFKDAIRESHATHALHLFGDPVLAALTLMPLSRVRISILLFRPRAHYPAAFGTHLTRRQRLSAIGYERILDVWRRRYDSHAVLTLDPEAARGWNVRRGAPATWLPEPFVAGDAPPRERSADAALYGSLGPRKGLHLLATALERTDALRRIIVAGRPEPGSEFRVESDVARIRATGRTVDLRPFGHTELQGLGVLAEAPLTLVPYQSHWGMSRVLLEAAVSGSAVVGTSHGLLGHLIRTYPLGWTADCHDPTAFAAALTCAAQRNDTDEAALSRGREMFLADFSRQAFDDAALAVLERPPNFLFRRTSSRDS